MDKHCKGCFYQIFMNNQSEWAFCGYKNIIEECKSKMNPDVELPYMNEYLRKTLKTMPKDSVLSCMFVQTCFDGKCPFKEEIKEETKPIDEEKTGLIDTHETRNGKKFIEIVVEYPANCSYPEYGGKPYFSIRYEENGEEIEGFGTYKPEVLSKYIREYFMPITHARWEIDKNDGEYHCTNCRAILEKYMYEWNNFYYCYHCGTRMDKEETRNEDSRD